MPWIFHAISTVMPATYFVNMIRAIVLRGATFADFWQDALIAATLFTAATTRFQKRLG